MESVDLLHPKRCDDYGSVFDGPSKHDGAKPNRSMGVTHDCVTGPKNILGPEFYNDGSDSI